MGCGSSTATPIGPSQEQEIDAHDCPGTMGTLSFNSFSMKICRWRTRFLWPWRLVELYTQNKLVRINSGTVATTICGLFFQENVHFVIVFRE
jgi:hypothetical protein